MAWPGDYVCCLNAAGISAKEVAWALGERRAVVRWEKALRRAFASLAQGRHLVVDWTRKHLQVIVWLVVAGLSAIGTWIALPAGITNLANGTSAKAQAPKGISISGVDTVHISYHVDLDRDDAGSATGYLLIYYTAGSNPTATLSPRLGYCSVPTGVETPLPVDRESPNNEGQSPATTFLSHPGPAPRHRPRSARTSALTQAKVGR